MLYGVDLHQAILRNQLSTGAEAKDRQVRIDTAMAREIGPRRQYVLIKQSARWALVMLRSFHGISSGRRIRNVHLTRPLHVATNSSRISLDQENKQAPNMRTGQTYPHNFLHRVPALEEPPLISGECA